MRDFEWTRSGPFRMVSALLVLALAGCGNSDLSEYRPARLHSSEARSSKPIVEEDLQTAAISSSTMGDDGHGSSASLAEDSSLASPELMPVSALVPVNVIDGANVRALMSVPAVVATSYVAPVNSDVSVVKESTAAVVAARQPEILIKDKTFRAEPKTGALRVSFDDFDLLKVLNMEPVIVEAVELMPVWLRGLDGKRIRVRGFMYPTYDTEGIEQFVLARDNQICCFGREPKVYDLVQIYMKAGKTTNYIPASRAFDVIGTFRIQLQAEEGKIYGLYKIDQAEVIDR